ncbi:MAG: spondin domain-containing protein [Dehalococcoidia bacterium]
MLIKSALVAGLGLLVVLALAAAGSTTEAAKPVHTYRVTLENRTSGQPLSPPVAATHRKSIRMFRVGKLASPGLEAIAEDGDQSMMFARFDGSDKATDAVDLRLPLTPSGMTATVMGMEVDDSETFDITAHPGDRFSLATMLICTNDGFTGLNAVKLPKKVGSVVEFMLAGYDAGTEDNTELSGDIVDPCSGLGPVGLPGDPDLNDDTLVDTAPPEAIHHHPGIMGVGELDPDTSVHGWTDPVAKVTIERL